MARTPAGSHAVLKITADHLSPTSTVLAIAGATGLVTTATLKLVVEIPVPPGTPASAVEIQARAVLEAAAADGGIVKERSLRMPRSTYSL